MSNDKDQVMIKKLEDKLHQTLVEFSKDNPELHTGQLLASINCLAVKQIFAVAKQAEIDPSGLLTTFNNKNTELLKQLI